MSVDRLAFHPGELAAQHAAGTAELAARVQPIIGETLPRGAAEFLTRQRLLVVGGQDHDGRVWASDITGPEGFLSAPDAATVEVRGQVVPGDPLASVLADEADIGTLAIDLVLRRRLRVNGRWRPVAGGGHLTVHQAFGNCPKYIQARALDGEPETLHPSAQRTTILDDRHGARITAADTFFIATAAAGGVDVSHRGGNPGFVRVLSPTELSWPDYVGNAMMMTAGNLRLNPAAGLLFPDWESGATLQLTGHAEVRSASAAVGGPATGQETVFRVDEVVWTENAFPTGWTAPTFSRFN